MKKLLFLILFVGSLFNLTNAQKTSCMADFNFEKDSTNLNANLFNFINLSFGNIAVYDWDFGDGNTSNFQNPSHSFIIPGIYQVCLVIRDTSDSPCSDSICISVDATMASAPTLGGQVFLDGLPINESDCFAILYSCDTSNNLTFADSFLIDTLGYYYFHQVAATTYKVLIESRNSQVSFIPRWYGNTYLWSDADTIILGSSNFDNDIYLNSKNTLTGTASASGKLEIHPFSPVNNIDLSNINLNLYDDLNNIVDSRKTDATHDFSFQNLTDGTYHIIPNLPNYLYQSNSFTINNSNDISNLHVYVYHSIFSSIKNVAVVENEVVLYPNPCLDIIYLKSDELINDIKIYDVNSKLILHKSCFNNYESLNIQNLKPATYFIKISTDNRVFSKLIIKQ